MTFGIDFQHTDTLIFGLPDDQRAGTLGLSLVVFF